MFVCSTASHRTRRRKESMTHKCAESAEERIQHVFWFKNKKNNSLSYFSTRTFGVFTFAFIILYTCSIAQNSFSGCIHKQPAHAEGALNIDAQMHRSDAYLSTFMHAAPLRDCAEALAAEGKTFISAAVPRQAASEITVTPHSLLIKELDWGALQTMWVDGGTSPDRICDCLHNARQVRYRAVVRRHKYCMRLLRLGWLLRDGAGDQRSARREEQRGGGNECRWKLRKQSHRSWELGGCILSGRSYWGVFFFMTSFVCAQRCFAESASVFSTAMFCHPRFVF